MMESDKQAKGTALFVHPPPNAALQPVSGAVWNMGGGGGGSPTQTSARPRPQVQATTSQQDIGKELYGALPPAERAAVRSAIHWPYPDKEKEQLLNEEMARRERENNGFEFPEGEMQDQEKTELQADVERAVELWNKEVAIDRDGKKSRGSVEERVELQRQLAFLRVGDDDEQNKREFDQLVSSYVAEKMPKMEVNLVLEEGQDPILVHLPDVETLDGKKGAYTSNHVQNHWRNDNGDGGNFLRPLSPNEKKQMVSNRIFTNGALTVTAKMDGSSDTPSLLTGEAPHPDWLGGNFLYFYESRSILGDDEPQEEEDKKTLQIRDFTTSHAGTTRADRPTGMAVAEIDHSIVMDLMKSGVACRVAVSHCRRRKDIPMFRIKAVAKPWLSRPAATTGPQGGRGGATVVVGTGYIAAIDSQIPEGPGAERFGGHHNGRKRKRQISFHLLWDTEPPPTVTVTPPNSHAPALPPKRQPPAAQLPNPKRLQVPSRQELRRPDLANSFLQDAFAPAADTLAGGPSSSLPAAARPEDEQDRAMNTELAEQEGFLPVEPAKFLDEDYPGVVPAEQEEELRDEDEKILDPPTSSAFLQTDGTPFGQPDEPLRPDGSGSGRGDDATTNNGPGPDADPDDHAPTNLGLGHDDRRVKMNTGPEEEPSARTRFGSLARGPTPADAVMMA
ncbi:unnamed protein product [Amoebophrya sp. A120]|nr:unnamed protein product [Amoebophrya sp. A120]|eukprot:GSA120T00006994001.1